MVIKLSEYLEKDTVAAEGKLDLGVAGRVGRGSVFHGDVDGDVEIMFESNGTFETRNIFSGFSFVEDNALTVNIYTDVSGNIIVQNKTVGTITVRNNLRGVA